MSEATAIVAPRPVTPTTILAEVLADLTARLESSGVDEVVVETARRAQELAVGLDPYLDRCTSGESTALADLARRTAERDWAANPAEVATVHLEQEMLSGHVEGQTLKFLVHLASARRVLEIGMFTGYSALAMAEAVEPGGTVTACEIDARVAAFAQECFDRSPVGDRIAVEVGPAADTLRRLEAQCLDGTQEPFDFVFVDADKPGYLDYVEILLAGPLLAPRAVIAVDNTLLQGEPYAVDGARSANGAAIAAFNAALTYDDRIEQVLLPVRDGITLIRRTPDGSR